MARTSGRVPSRLEAPVTATTRVRSPNRSVTASTESSALPGSNGAQRTVAPASSAARTQGRMLASWSSRVTTTSSPADHCLAIARETSNVSWVIDRPKTTPSGEAPSRSATAWRASLTTASARCSAAVTVPRFAMAAVMVPAMAWPT